MPPLMAIALGSTGSVGLALCSAIAGNQYGKLACLVRKKSAAIDDIVRKKSAAIDDIK